ncbi:MAG: hypothetical protein LIR50_19205 [Bacillota bacterium]|nr:hypothetical protein [Bacillota bacterium]
MKKNFELGKIDFYGTGRKINAVTVKIELTEENVFTACGYVWNIRRTDCVSGGQNLDEIYKFKKNNPIFKVIYEMWKKHHLNDMHAGTEKQEEALEKAGYTAWARDYEKCCEYLESVGLLEDNGYKFGTGWLKREIPQEDLEKIRGLFN